MKMKDIKKEVMERLNEFLEFNKIKFIYLYGSIASGTETDMHILRT